MTRVFRRSASISLLLLSLVAPVISLAQAQDQPWDSARDSASARPLHLDRGSVALAQTLQKLHTRASMAMVTAHPDDEDGGLLAYEARGQGVDASVVSLNRGEGGQNVMTSDFWDELGTLRTQEHLAATEFYGAHLYYTRVADFGFSKTMEESLRLWGDERVLYDVVRAIRIARPLVVTSVFVGNVSDGHGHHQVAGYAAQMAYKLAGDPNVFPEQIKEGLLPWTPLKVYARVPFARVTKDGVYDYATGHYAPVRFRNYVTGEWIEGVPTATVEIPSGQYDPVLGATYVQIGREGLNNQKTQLGGVAIPFPRPTSSPYHLYASRVKTAEHEDSFFDGIDISLAGIASYAPLAEQARWRSSLGEINAFVEYAISNFDARHPEAIAPTLAKGLAATNALLDEIAKSDLSPEARYNMTHELTIKQQQFEQALQQSLGLVLVANTSEGSGGTHSGPFGDISLQLPTSQTVIPGQPLTVEVHIANQGPEAVTLSDVQVLSLAGPDWGITAKSSITGEFAAGTSKDAAFAITVPPTAELTKPYFSRPSLEQPYYNLDDTRFLNLPTRPYPLLARAAVSYHGVSIALDGVVQTVHPVHGIGPVLEPLLVAPAISLLVTPKAGIVPINDGGFDLHVKLRSSVRGEAQGTVRLDLPPGWTSTPAVADFATAREGEEQNLVFRVQPATVEAKPYTITAVAEYNGKTYTEGFETVGYPGVRPYPHYRPATYRATGVDVKIAPGLRVGYIMGTGDEVARSLENFGIHATLLTPEEVTSGDLAQFDATVIGIRAYAARAELVGFNNRLLDYVRGGGTLIVQYQTAEFDHNYGPYPLTFSNDAEKVVEEDGKVQLLLPGDPVLSWPNKITTADFDGWVEERGHGFMRQWDERYIAPTEMHDTDQAPQKGGLLYTRYGKGHYVYLAYAFFRQ
ncbi:MAG: PIG-L family deacetylase, partial [Acidobacteriaceae bacterium]|nr:PIG-L family deacetylase [Acidobacteriaceae bacterium]